MTGAKLCVVSCYKDTGYIRTKNILRALDNNGIEYTYIHNNSKGPVRYLEVIRRLIKARLVDKPDVYYVMFRGYEILPFVLLFGAGSRVVFDEFINPIEWLVYEHKKIKSTTLVKLFTAVYKYLLSKVHTITTDTKSHAEYSSEITNTPLKKYINFPVCSDEDVFRAEKRVSINSTSKDFVVLFYGTMLPLHGLDVILGSAERLLGQGDVKFVIIGGKKDQEAEVRVAIEKGANIEYHPWVEFSKLPEFVNRADLCLGGPFGDTVQSQFVVTGKTTQFISIGKPVIIGINKESKELFRDKEDALLVKQGSVDDLSQAILWGYKNKQKLEQIGKQGRTVYVERLSQTVVNKSIEGFLKTV